MIQPRLILFAGTMDSAGVSNWWEFKLAIETWEKHRVDINTCSASPALAIRIGIVILYRIPRDMIYGLMVTLSSKATNSARLAETLAIGSSAVLRPLRKASRG
jgi:hypothetical protein